MARIPLSTRADRIAKRNLDQPLSKTGRQEQDRFARAIGVDPAKFASYKPSTKRRYIRAAQKGQTAAQYRAQEKDKRQRRQAARQRDPRWTRIDDLVKELKAEGMVVIAGEHTLTDRLDYEDLYSDESLRAHVEIYGFDYVIARLEHQYRALRQYNTSQGRNRSIGRAEMMRQFGTTVQRDFRASGFDFTDNDERWFWYHATSVYYTYR